MWAVRILNGPQAGQVFPLKMGKNTLGRSLQSDVKITTQGISKNHCEIHVSKDKIILTDMQSSNGTYVGGVKIQNGILHIGEKFSIHDVVLDLIPAPEVKRPSAPVAHPPTAYQGSAAVQLQPQMASMPHPYPQAVPQYQAYGSAHGHAQPQGQAQTWVQDSAQPSSPIKAFMVQFQDYMERVVLPGVYRLAQMFDFKWVLGGFVAVYIVTVTFLSIIPTTQLAKSSVMMESQKRAQSLARNLAMANRKALVEGNLSSLSTYSAEVEDGVKSVFLMQDSDGMILAPATKAGRISDLSFTNQVRKERRPLTSLIDSNTLGASFPIDAYDPEAGEMKIRAHAVIIYDISSVSFDEGKTISLFMQTLMMASLAGALLFFFLYKLIEFPLSSLNQQLDSALRDKKSDLEMTFQFPVLQDLTGTMNSVLTRLQSVSDQGGFGGPSSAVGDFQSQVENLMFMLGVPGLAIDGQNAVRAVNSKFEQLTRADGNNLKNQGLSAIPDGALQQNIADLLQKAKDNPSQVHADQLEFGGRLCVIQCQAFISHGIFEYGLISILPAESGGG